MRICQDLNHRDLAIVIPNPREDIRYWQHMMRRPQDEWIAALKSEP
jgi:hypothetical protein